MLMQEGFQNVNSMSVVDRTRLWAEYKEKKIREAKELKDQQEKIAQDCTFKPQINNAYNTKRKTARQQYDDGQQQNKGLDKYLQRMHQAREKKEELHQLEEKLFKKGQNWKPKLTTPIEPNITSFKKNNNNTTERENGNYSQNNNIQVKSLNKPVNPLQQQQQQATDYNKMRTSQISRTTNQYEGGNSNELSQQNDNTLSPVQIKNTRDFVRMTKRNKDQFVELRSDMHYDEAVSLIHQHIINLDI